MNDEPLRLRLLAIRKRRQFLAKLYSENGRALERAGLVSLSRAVYLLATRYVMPPEWPGHDVSEDTQLNWELEWYSSYLHALEVLTPRLQAALRSRAITPRDALTRAPMDPAQMSQWLQLDANAVIAASAKTFWSVPIPDTDATLWADASLMTSGVFATANDIAAWAEGEGIAAPGEVAAMLRDHDELAAAAFGAPEKDAPSGPVVTPDEATDSDDSAIAALFDPVKAAQLEAMFPDNGKWATYTERAARNGLKEAAKDGVAKFNPYRAAVWWMARGPNGWTLERCLRKLANNLPERSIDSKHLLMGEDE